MLVGGIAVSGDWERQSAEHEIDPHPSHLIKEDIAL